MLRLIAWLTIAAAGHAGTPMAARMCPYKGDVQTPRAACQCAATDDDELARPCDGMTYIEAGECQTSVANVTPPCCVCTGPALSEHVAAKASHMPRHAAVRAHDRARTTAPSAQLAAPMANATARAPHATRAGRLRPHTALAAANGALLPDAPMPPAGGIPRSPAAILRCLLRNKYTPLRCSPTANASASLAANSSAPDTPLEDTLRQPPPPTTGADCSVGQAARGRACDYGHGTCVYTARLGWYCECVDSEVVRGLGLRARDHVDAHLAATSPGCLRPSDADGQLDEARIYRSR